MNEIINFAIQRTDNIILDHSPRIKLERCKWLQKPLNWLLFTLKAYREISIPTYNRVEVKVDLLRLKIQRLVNEKMITGKRPRTIILGYNQYKELVSDANIFLGYGTMDTKFQYCGLSVIFDPSIDGMILLDFTP